MYVVNGGEPEVSAVRKCFHDRWPYPLVKDAQASSSGSGGDGGGGVWLFKVKRYPWHSSRTGNKHLDKFIEAAKAVAASAAAVSANASTNTAVASRLPGLKAQTASPSPAAASNEQPPNAAAAAKQRVSAPPNMDSEAGQSMLVFIVKVRLDLFFDIVT